VNRWVLERIIVVSVLLFVSCQSGVAQNKAEFSDDRDILVESFVISGTQSVDSAELAEITNSMAGSRFNDDAEVLQERIRLQFQDRGYFTAVIEKLDIKVIDPLSSPKPVRLEAQVTEGPRCRLSRIEFTGNHALSSVALRAKFPMRKGDAFRRAKIAGGLEAIRKLYLSTGFLDFTGIPDTKIDSSSTVTLNIEVQEGPQYRMDKFEVIGTPEVAEKLQVRWELGPGSVFNHDYVETFLDKNHSLLPADFVRYNNGVELFKDCSDATVSVHLHLTNDPQHAALDRTKHVDCSKPADSKKK
jgi:outer membrane protein assembly factor BamA